MEVLAEGVWRARELAHAARADGFVAGHLDRAERQRKHPVEDFLFTYYSAQPGQLRRWHPGAGVALENAAERAAWRDHTHVATAAPAGGDHTHVATAAPAGGDHARVGAAAPAGGDRARVEGAAGERDRPGGEGAVALDLGAFVARRGDAVRHVRELLAATASRPAQLGCFGLHEWAMVYRQGADEVRHSAWPLRLGAAGTDGVVERHRIRCTHHDAFRFFTDDARPLNALQPSRADQVALEQPGCLHATMDLYKWAYKLGPAVPGELLLDCFELARDTRFLDMRASPYDLRELGFEPVPIETAEGKAAYVEAQRALAARAAPLRERLLAVCETVLAAGAVTAGRRLSPHA